MYSGMKGAKTCIFLSIFFLGWHRTTGKGCAPRRQRPQPAQYSGHHHCELLISPSSHQITSSCLCPLLLSDLSGFPVRLFSTHHVSFQASHLEAVLIVLPAQLDLFIYYPHPCTGHVFVLFQFPIIFCSSIQMKLLYLKLHHLDFL